LKRIILPPGVDARLFNAGIVRVAHPCDNPTSPYEKPSDIPNYLGLLDHGRSLSKKEYEKAIAFEEERLNTLVRQLEDLKLSLAVTFQGRDGAGKSGATKRIITGLDFDMKVLGVVPVGPPNDEEAAQPYLLRFFERDRMPAYGQVRIFDRGWNEELLVVPVMKLASKEHVQGAYGQINTMEWMMAQSGTILVKIWLEITKDVQHERFKERKETKEWKYTEADATARKNWPGYTKYANKMFHLTGTHYSHWNILPSNCKRFSRVTVLRIISDEVEKRIALTKKR
jgi:AMP-polyphosphate phosphotransferase